MTRVSHGRKLGFSYRLTVCLVRPFMLIWTKRDWRGSEYLLATGKDSTGIIACPNHISWFDPLQCAHYLYDNGRPPRFLGKEAVFRIPVAGRIIRGAGQIPVYRNTADAGSALRAAVAALQVGECVVVYPEGTISGDPGLWPMTGKTGAARLALETGAPLIPIGQWGAHDVMPPYRKVLRLIPRKTMRVLAGPPLDLTEFQDRPIDHDVLAEVTRRLMVAITANVATLRGEVAPTVVFDGRVQPPQEGVA